MNGEEIGIHDLPPMSGEELGNLLVNLVAQQAQRIEDLQRQLEKRGRTIDDLSQIAEANRRTVEQLRAEQDAELWRAGAPR